MAAPTVSISPELEKKFEDIANTKPQLSSTDLNRVLAAAPTATLKTYATWLIQSSASQADHAFNTPPPSNKGIAQLINKTKFDDVHSLFTLNFTIIDLVPPAPFALGNFTGAGNEKISLLLEFRTDLLPLDVEPNFSSSGSLRTIVTAEPPTPTIPRLFYQLGQIFKAPSPTTSLQAPTATPWILIVAPSREAFALYNPTGSTVEDVPANNVEPDAYKTRPTGGVFPGFSKVGTLVPLAKNVDDLFKADVAAEQRVLAVKESELVTLPKDTTLKIMEEDPVVALKP